jgi:hypothetical protein
VDLTEIDESDFKEESEVPNKRESETNKSVSNVPHFKIFIQKLK